MLVEDDPETSRFVADCLSRDYDVSRVRAGHEGLVEALRVRPALVITDISLPELSGPELIVALRSQPELATTPVLVLSARSDEELLAQLLDHGAQDFIMKPFSERELCARVRNLVSAQQARAQVSSLRDAAESANRAKDEFLAMLGHELRNPLSPILTALQLMRLSGESGSERERVVIERQVSHLTRLVDDLLDVSRIAQGRVELRLEVHELADIVDKAIEMASPLLEQRRHALTLDVPRQDLRVEGDATRLQQVISNLLTNAAKYTPPGGHISVRGECADGQVMLTVRDNGIGISAEMLPRVFELFMQGRQAIDRAQGGLGIGLSIVRSLVELHSGTVAVRSAGQGRGSEFELRLPHTSLDAASNASRPTPEPGVLGVGSIRVLIVDDNEDGAEMLARALTRRGYDTRMAHDAPTALSVATSFAPQFACLDIGLPVMDGYELAVHLRAIRGLEALRLIAITGYGQESDRQKTLEAGFERHLVKPVAVEAVEAVLKQSL